MNAREVYPHCVLYSLALKAAQERGLHYVNLGGVNPGNEGLKRFKHSWGAQCDSVPIIRWRFDGPPLVRRVSHYIDGWLKSLINRSRAEPVTGSQ